MKDQIKKAVKAVIHRTVNFIGQTRVGRYLENRLIESVMERFFQISHQGISLIFSAPNALSKFRYETFSSKEPETLEWINKMPAGAVFWDVGANIGLYSVYAAKKRKCKVYAFEPSVFNLELLARNIYLNDLSDSICIVPIALSDRLGSGQMRMTTTEWGGALSTFGQEFGWDGDVIRPVFKFQTIGLTMTDAVRNMAIPMPDYIKMDVDGLEHFILQGGSDVLRSIKGILIEVNDNFHQQAEQCQQLLSEAGLKLREKRHSEITAFSTAGFQNTYNYIWIR